MLNLLKKLIADESGASLIEYVLLAALIGVAALVGMRAVGFAANTELNTVSGQMTAP